MPDIQDSTTPPDRIPRAGEQVGIVGRKETFVVLEARLAGYVDLIIPERKDYILRSVSAALLIYMDDTEA